MKTVGGELDGAEFIGDNVASKMQYITSGRPDDPFDKKCQPIKTIADSVMNAGEEVGKAILSGLGIDL